MTATRAGAESMIWLPGEDGDLAVHHLRAPADWQRPSRPIASRRAFAAAHVVPTAWADTTPGAVLRGPSAAGGAIDWDATLAIRREVWSWGLGVAEAMDTAQRGAGLGWPAAAELVRRSAAEARAVGGSITAGAGTDHLDLAALPGGRAGLVTVVDAYRRQVETVAEAGAVVTLMASRALARVARGPEDYLEVYSAVLAEVERPVILHWLGAVFDPALAGYWGQDDPGDAARTVLALVTEHARVVDGIKVSLLDADHERRLRADLPAGVRCYTGDDHHYPELVVGDQQGWSDALLGVFTAIAPAASTALQALDAGRPAAALRLLETTQPLAQHLFAAPVPSYKAGIAFLAWLDGLQPRFTMLGGAASWRSLPHLAELFRLADAAGLLRDPAVAAERMRLLLAVHGVEA